MSDIATAVLDLQNRWRQISNQATVKKSVGWSALIFQGAKRAALFRGSVFCCLPLGPAEEVLRRLLARIAVGHHDIAHFVGPPRTTYSESRLGD
jgi:hypothetical protein